MDEIKSSEENASNGNHHLSQNADSRKQRAFKKFLIASVGAIPWVGGFLSASMKIPGELEAEDGDQLRTEWLHEHDRKFEQLGNTIRKIGQRLEQLGNTVDDRIESPEYLALVRQAFRAWDHAETEDKREYTANLIVNSAGTRLCSDDVIRLFISWIEQYHEAHFMIIREIHQNPGVTRKDIWDAIHGGRVREDSADADLFSYLIRELSQGGIIRQDREKTASGQFVRKRPARSSGRSSGLMKSKFDDKEEYVLTELGKQFVHYTLMSEVGRLEEKR